MMQHTDEVLKAHLAKERGWFPGGRDLAGREFGELPVSEHARLKFDSYTYFVSQLHACLVL